MKYRIQPKGEWYIIQRLERRSLFKKQWTEITKVAMFDMRFIMPLVPKTASDKEKEEKMPEANAQHAIKILEEVKKADAIVEGKQ